MAPLCSSTASSRVGVHGQGYSHLALCALPLAGHPVPYTSPCCRSGCLPTTCHQSAGAPGWELWRQWVRSWGQRRRKGCCPLGSAACPCPPQAGLALHTMVPGTREWVVSLGLHAQCGSLSYDCHPLDLCPALCPGHESCHSALGPGGLASKRRPCRAAHIGGPPH